MMRDSADDELGRLLAAATSPAPDDLSARLLQRVAVARASGRTVALLAAAAGLLVGLAALAVLFGRALSASGTLDLLLVGAQDWRFVRDDARGYALALRDAFPWIAALALMVTALALALTLRQIARATTIDRRPDRRRQPGLAPRW